MLTCIQETQCRSTVELHGWSPQPFDLLAALFPAAILNCGGWILDHAAPDDGPASYLVEFPCERSLEVYTALVTLGIQLSRSAHLNLTRLWQCARQGKCLHQRPVVRIRMTLQSAATALVAAGSQARTSAK